jgi:cellobiose-specific phosphotransferase system component IIA
MLPDAAMQQTEEVDMAKLDKIVKEAIASISNATGLSSGEALKVIEEVNVATSKDATREAMREISVATDLNTDIFTESRTATVDEIVAISKIDWKNLLAY